MAAASKWSAVTSGAPESFEEPPLLVDPPHPDATAATVAAVVAKPKIH
jgi:hypothetical protein